MGGAKLQLEEYYTWLEDQDFELEEYYAWQDLEVQASYDEVRSRLRLSCVCKKMRRDLSYPFTNRIVEMALDH